MIEEFQFSTGKWQVRIVGPGGGLVGAFKFDADFPDLQIGRLLPHITGVRTVADLPPGWGVMFIRLAADPTESTPAPSPRPPPAESD